MNDSARELTHKKCVSAARQGYPLTTLCGEAHDHPLSRSVLNNMKRCRVCLTLAGPHREACSACRHQPDWFTPETIAQQLAEAERELFQ